MAISNNFTYQANTDYQGTIMAITNQSCSLVAELSYDVWGRRRNPANWSYTGFASPLFVRGYTGQVREENNLPCAQQQQIVILNNPASKFVICYLRSGKHLYQFSLINMLRHATSVTKSRSAGNGRCYDPVLGRFLSLDLFVQYPEHTQSYNRYGYVLNNPTIYTDPSGQFFLLWVASALVKVAAVYLTAVAISFVASEIKGVAEAIKTGDWTNADPTLAGTPGNNSLRLSNGLVIYEEHSGEPAWQIIRRLTWQGLTTFAGFMEAQSRNMVHHTEVGHWHGATFQRDHNKHTSGIFSAGGYLTINKHQELDESDFDLIHEYGHFEQERDWGPLALISGIESAISYFMYDNEIFDHNHDKSWFERDANYRGYYYFKGRDEKIITQERFNNLEIKPRNFDDYYFLHSLLILFLIFP